MFVTWLGPFLRHNWCQACTSALRPVPAGFAMKVATPSTQPVDLLVQILEMHRSLWHRMTLLLRSQAAGGHVPEELVIEPYLRLLVPDMALRVAALIELGHMSEVSVEWAMVEGPTPLKHWQQKMPEARLRREDLLYHPEHGKDDISERFPKATLDDLLYHNMHVPKDDTVCQLARVLAKASGQPEDRVRIGLRREYALRPLANA